MKTHEGEVYWEKLNNTGNINREKRQERNEIIGNDERDIDNHDYGEIEEIDNNKEIDMINEDEIIDIINEEDVINEDEEININENEETEYTITAELVSLLNYFPNNCCTHVILPILEIII